MTALHQMTTQQKMFNNSNQRVNKNCFNKVNLSCRHTVILQVELLHDMKNR